MVGCRFHTGNVRHGPPRESLRKCRGAVKDCLTVGVNFIRDYDAVMCAAGPPVARGHGKEGPQQVSRHPVGKG
ncbi:hypothetical protein [Azospirillum argentinense]